MADVTPGGANVVPGASGVLSVTAADDSIVVAGSPEDPTLAVGQFTHDHISDWAEAAGGDKTFHFVQNVAATVWDIEHNLAKFPSVTVIDSGGTMVVGDVLYLDENHVRLTFSAAFAGTADLN